MSSTFRWGAKVDPCDLEHLNLASTIFDTRLLDLDPRTNTAKLSMVTQDPRHRTLGLGFSIHQKSLLMIY